jgi:hypothetical protein
MQIEGKLEEGLYVDDCQDMDPANIHLFYRTSQRYEMQRANHTGAGNSINSINKESESESNWNDFDSDSDAFELGASDTGSEDSQSDHSSGARSSETNSETDSADSDPLDNISQNFYHQVVKAPKTRDPLVTMELCHLFHNLLDRVIKIGHCPEGFGLLSKEWSDRYPTTQDISTGHHGKKKLTISLPIKIWYPRAVLWVQARHALTIVQQQFQLYLVTTFPLS